VTPLNAILGSQASAILVLAVVGVLLLAATAAVLDYLGNSSRVLAPLSFEWLRQGLFVWLGLPSALGLVISGGLLGAVASAVAETGEGTRVLLWLANATFLVAVVVCGCCSPLARHWGLGMAAFAMGLGMIFPLLKAISSLGFNDAGLLRATGDRVAFGIVVGGILLSLALCGAAVLAMMAYVLERMLLIVRARRHHAPRGPWPVL
jgi:hypothetical protein